MSRQPDFPRRAERAPSRRDGDLSVGGSSTWLIARFELIRHLRSFRYLVASLLLVVLSACVTWLGHVDYELRSSDYEASRESSRIATQNAKVYSFVRPVVAQPPSPLAIFEQGVSGRVGREVEISPFTVPARATGEHRGNASLARWLDLDLTTVVVVVAGFLALLLSFDALVDERQRFDLLLFHGAGRAQLLAGKVMALTAALAVSLLLVMGPPLLVLAANGLLIQGSNPWRLLGLFLAGLVYCVLMALFGLWVSLRSASKSRSLAYAMLGWIALVLILPGTVTGMLEVWLDLRQDPGGVERRVEAIEAELETRLEEAWEAESIRLEPSGHTAPVVLEGWDHRVLRRLGSAAYYDSVARYHAVEVELGRIYAARIYELRASEQERLRRLAARLGWVELLMPARLLERLSAKLAGTARSDHDAFLAAARHYRESMLADFEQAGAFESWRWFTDDPPATMPWVSFLELDVEDVSAANISEAAARFRSAPVQARVEEELAHRDAAPSSLELEPPPFRPATAEGTTRRVLLFFAAFLALAGLVASLVVRAMRRLWQDDEWSTETEGAGERAADPVREPRSFDLLRAELDEITSRVSWRLIAVAVVALMVIGAVLQGLQLRLSDDTQRSLLAEYGERVEGKSLAEIADIRHPALRPPSRHAVLAEAGEHSMSSLYELGLSTWHLPALTTAAPADFRTATHGSPDWSFVVWVLLSFSTCLLGYDAFSRHQLRRVALVHVLGATRRRILGTRWLALWLATTLPFAVGAALGLGAIHLFGEPARAPDLGKVATFLCIAAWGLSFFTSLALFVSAFFARAEKALVTLVLVWVAAVVVIPPATAILVMRLVPVSTERELALALEDIRQRAEAVDGSSDWRPARWARADDYAVEKRSARLQVERRDAQVELLERFADRQLRQAEIARRLAYFSPTALLEDLSERLLGVGIYRQRDFLEQAKRFETRLQRWTAEKDRLDPESPHLLFFPRYLSTAPVRAEEVPRFRFVEPSLADGLRRAAGALLLFAALHAVLARLTRWTFERRLSSSVEKVMRP